MTEMSTTRGVSFDPAVASATRTRTEAQARAHEAWEARQEAARRREERREQGRRLDQEELSYKQYTPPQMRDWR